MSVPRERVTTGRVGRDVAANLFGQAWAGALGLVAVPIYRHFLGTEAYGLLGFFLSLQALSAVFEFGLASTVNREVARRRADPRTASECRPLMSTFEVTHWGIGTLAGLALVVGADWVATWWLNPREMATDGIAEAVRLYAALLAIRWPAALYRNVLLAIERQLPLNVTLTAAATANYLGAAAVVAWLSPTVQMLLFWQICVQVLEVAVLRALIGLYLPPSSAGGAGVSLAMLTSSARFTASMLWISVLWTILAHADKILVSRLLPLEDLGYYAIASALAGGVQLLYLPVFNAVYPRFSRWHAAGNPCELASTYHKAARIVAWITAPVAAVLVCFPREVLLLWTRSEDVSQHGALPLALLAGGYLLAGLMTVPYALQLAAGLTHIQARVNLLSVVVVVPLMVGAVQAVGVAGAGVGWLTVNLLHWLVIPHLLHANVLSGEKARWLARDTLPYVGTSLIAFLPFTLARAQLSDLVHPVAPIASALAVYAGASWILWRRRGAGALLRRLVRS